MAKKALLVGVNYPNSKYELKGCVNDVFNMVELLKEYYGFEEENIKILIDTDDSYESPTGSNIKKALKEFVQSSEDGDVMYFHFSGHGVQVPDKDGDEADGKDEALVATDINLISDDDLRAIVRHLNPGAKFTMISDCCHSGGMLDHEQVVIEGDKKDDDDIEVPDEPDDSVAREIPASGLMEMLSERAGFDITNATEMEYGLARVFGHSASKRATRKLAQKEERGILGDLAGMGAQLAMAALKINDEPQASREPENVPAEDDTPLPDELGVLITGCQSTETSADVRPGNDPNRACGALSNAIQTVVKSHAEANPDEPIGTRKLVLEARALLKKKGFTQNPCLECMEGNADKSFLLQE